MEETPNEANTSTNINENKQKSSESHEESLQERINRILSDNDDIDGINENDVYEEDDFEDDEDFERDLHLMTEGLNRLTQNKTFSADKLREIDRKNALLMERILANNRRPNQYKKDPNVPKPKTTSAAINRRRNQQKINVENQILLRKIQKVKPSITHNPK